jgi:adenylate cyclase
VPDPAPAPQHTFAFADLAGFTALTEAHGDDAGAAVAADFERRVREVLAGHDAEEVKSIGDAVMLRAADPGTAVALARRLVAEVGGRPGVLGVRVGMHTGPAVRRDGDWFGAAVNLAARVASVAVAGEVLMTRETRAAAAAALDGLELRPLGPRRFKNVAEPVELFALRAPAEAVDELAADPVCRIVLGHEQAVVTLVHRGAEQRFCSQACAARFAAAPERYLGRGADRLDLRVSDAARERVALRLGRAYRGGRMEADELEARLARTYAAAVRADLAAVTRDLPRRRRRRPAGPLGAMWMLWRTATAPVRRRVRARRRRR